MLEINNFDEKDIGDYVIELSETEKSAPAKVSLRVEPIIELSKEVRDQPEVILQAGKPLRFEAIIKGFPAPRFEGFVNNAPIKEAAQVREDEENISIRIQELSRAHAGELILKASNEVGTTIKTFLLRITDVPRAPKTLDSDNITDSSVDLSWRPSPADPDSPVDYYAIERKTADTSRWRQVGKTKSEITRFTAEGLYPEEFYIFRVVAVNEIGRSEPTNSVDVMTPASADDVEEVSLALSTTSEPKSITPLDRPSRPSVTRVDDRKVDVTWTPVEGGFVKKNKKSKNIKTLPYATPCVTGHT